MYTLTAKSWKQPKWKTKYIMTNLKDRILWSLLNAYEFSITCEILAY